MPGGEEHDASLFRLFVETAQDVVLARFAPDGRITYTNPAVEAVLGRPATRGVGPGALASLHPDDRDPFVTSLRAALRGTSGVLTVRSRHADGSWRHLQTRLVPQRGDDGSVEGVLAAAVDTTAAVQAAELAAAERARAEQSSAFLQTVLDTIDVGVVACDAEGHLTLFNSATRAFHGLPPDPAVDPADWASRYALLDADSRPLPAQQVPLRRTLAGDVVSGDVMVIAPAGLAPHRVRCTGQQLHDADGTLTGAVVSMADITAETEAHAAVSLAHHQLEHALDAMPRAVLLADLGGDGEPFVRWANDHLCAQQGSLRSELVGRRLDEVFPAFGRQ